MKTYNVRQHGKLLKSFETKEEAKKWLMDYMMVQELHRQSLDFVDEAVLQSNLSEAKAVINHIMELR